MPWVFARPFGWREDFELRSNLADSQADADSTTVRQRTCLSAPVVLSMYETAVEETPAALKTARA